MEDARDASPAEVGSGEDLGPLTPGATVLDRVHQAMLLFGTGRAEALKRFVVEEGAAIAGEASPERWRLGGWTDPILAVFAGLPAASLLSIGPGYFPGYHHHSDVAERVQWHSVASCARIAAGTVQALARRL